MLSGKNSIVRLIFLIGLGLSLIFLKGCSFLLNPALLEWEYRPADLDYNILMNDPEDSNLVKLRKDYKLDKIVAGSGDDYGRLKKIVKWTKDRWKHSGSRLPSRFDPLTILEEASEGKRFRCVEYAIVAAACARAFGMPSRVLALKTKDVETAASSAGHVVAEVWLDQFHKWAFIDPQFDAIPEINGTPLNAVEFQKAIAIKDKNLKIHSSSRGFNPWFYKKWVSPYLYYFDFAIDQRFFIQGPSKKKGVIMLVPKGAVKPRVFQRKYPIKNCIYISNPDLFYPTLK